MTRPRVVVVDDSPEFLSLASEILLAGYDVVQLSGEGPTLEEIESARPDVIVLDLAFGDDDNAGWDLLGQLRAGGSLTSQAPVIICSGAVETIRRHRDHFDSLSGVLLLEKPFAVHEFERMVREAVGGALPA